MCIYKQQIRTELPSSINFTKGEEEKNNGEGEEEERRYAI